jgi:hypothetical protein
MNMCNHLAKKLRVPVIAVSVLLVFAIECMAEPGIVNPVADFLSHRSVPVEDKLLKLETDLNHAYPVDPHKPYP